MQVHVFASYGTDTYLVHAESEPEAKGLMWDEDTTGEVEYVGTAEEILTENRVEKVSPH